MTLTVLDPTAEETAEQLQPAPLLESVDVLKGATVGFISNGKEGTEGFFKHMECLLKETFQVGEVVSLCKSNYSAPAEDEIIDAAKDWTLAITGLGDWGSCSSCSLHDAIACEKVGTPAVGVMTNKFASAAELMARVLGMPDYKFPVIEHPVSSATNEGLKERAKTVVAAITELKIRN